jgi:hypothetical protein
VAKQAKCSGEYCSREQLQICATSIHTYSHTCLVCSSMDWCCTAGWCSFGDGSIITVTDSKHVTCYKPCHHHQITKLSHSINAIGVTWLQTMSHANMMLVLPCRTELVLNSTVVKVTRWQHHHCG